MSERAAAWHARDLDAQQWLLIGSGVLTAAGLGLAGQAAALLFTAAQTAVLGGLLMHALRGRTGWRSAEFVVVASWFLLFTVPCWLYALDPALLDQGSSARATLIVNIALYGYALGLLPWRSSGPPVEGRLAVVPVQPRTRVLTAWWMLGFAALAALLLRHGNPLEYLSHLDRSAALNLGAFYLVALALTMRFSVLAWAAARWSSGERLEPLAVALVIAGTILIGLTGGRLFVAIAIADFLLLYVLVRRPIPLKRLLPYAVAAGLLIVFGIGTLKRYQGYNATHPESQVGIVEYVTDRAPGELASAYANNYVDTIRLVAIADRLVPRQAAWEGERVLLEMAVKPLPRSIRPEIDRQPVLARELSPSDDYVYAVPLVATSFLAGGLLVVMLVSGALGVFVRSLDRWLVSDALSAQRAVVFVVAAVSVPSLLRAGLPGGVVVLVGDVVGMWVVARTGLQRPADA